MAPGWIWALGVQKSPGSGGPPLKIQFTLLGISGYLSRPVLAMILWPCHDPFYFLPTLSRLLCDDSYSEYMRVSYIKSLTLLTTAEIQRGLFPYLWFHRLIFIFFFNLAPCPKEMNSLLWFLGLFLASFKTCLLIASEPLRQAQLHPPAPSLTFLGLVLMLLNPWQSETHCIFFE